MTHCKFCGHQNKSGINRYIHLMLFTLFDGRYVPYQMLSLVFFSYLEGNTGGFALENPNCLQAISASV